MCQYKKSIYNILIPWGEKTYLWNTFSGAFLSLNCEGKDFYDEYDGRNSDSPFFRTLLEQRCIVDVRLDEVGKVLFDEKSIMMNLSPKKQYYTIAPGLGCNYRCNYCFENERTSFAKMTPETQLALYNYITKNAEQNKYLQGLCFTWFGGEPLLYLDVVEALGKQLMHYCQERGLQYYSGMISNGRFLTKDAVTVLQRQKLGHLQISVDGTESVYCSKKNATAEDFRETIDNISYAADYLPIAVRINVSGDNFQDALRLTEFLLKDRGLDGKIKVYVAHVREYTRKLTAKEEHALHRNFLRFEGEYMKLFWKGGPYRSESFEFREPRRRGTTCLSVCNSNACIGPEGEIYQCEHHFGIPESVIGTIFDGAFYSENKQKYLTFTHYPKCKVCPIFPVCLGGCMDDMVNCRNMIDCTAYRQRIIDLKLLSLAQQSLLK